MDKVRIYLLLTQYSINLLELADNDKDKNLIIKEIERFVNLGLKESEYKLEDEKEKKK